MPAALGLAWALAGTLGGCAASAAPARTAAPAAAPARHAALPAEWVEIARAEDQREWKDGTLKRLLAHADPATRARAALATGRLQDTLAVPALLPLLRDPAAEVREEAIFALGQIGFAHPAPGCPAVAAARDPLAAALAGADAPTASLLVEALGKLQDKRATGAVAAQLGHDSPHVRAHAAVALWWLADSTALGALIARHEDPEADVRWRVLYALEKIMDTDHVVLVSALSAGDEHPQVRAQAVRTIGRQKSNRGTAYALQLIGDPAVEVAVNAIRAVQQIADSTSVRVGPALARALTHAAHPYVRATAATALAERFAWVPADSARREGMRVALHAALADSDVATRGSAARALLMRAGVAALDSVRPLLADPSVHARVPVLQGLGSLPAATAMPLLLERLAEAPGRHLLERMTAAEVIGQMRAREGVAALRARLDDREPLLVASAASALAELGDSASVPRLMRAYAARAADADADARIALRDAVRALAGDMRADSLERRHPARNAAPPRHDATWAAIPTEKGAILATTRGEIEWAFDATLAPQTVRNFVRLARGGYFDSLAVHRVVPHFVIQDGDPTGTGSGGPGWTIRCEYNRLRYDAGMVGMALAGKDTGGSQWFITHSPQPHLNGRYTIFARVVRGMDVVRRIAQGDRILKVTVLE